MQNSLSPTLLLCEAFKHFALKSTLARCADTCMYVYLQLVALSLETITCKRTKRTNMVSSLSAEEDVRELSVCKRHRRSGLHCLVLLIILCVICACVLVR